VASGVRYGDPAAQAELALKEGILVEPAGAASVAGMIAAARAGALDTSRCVVCLLTGHGFKDPSSLALITDRSAAALIARSGIPTILTDGAAAGRRHIAEAGLRSAPR
jgi:threonine synthase